MLTVYKASAGSGKTFQLVIEYLKLLIQNQHNYKHILAVTFTNKATNEMKSRILEQLHLLGSNQESKYLPVLVNELSVSEIIIRNKAKQVLKNILHDYNRFSINTIDSFTQRVIKAFNRELGISPNFMLELDSSLVLEEAVDRLLAKIDQDKNLLKWLVKFSEEKIKDNRSQRIEEDLKSLGKELFNERFQIFFTESRHFGYSRKNLNAFRKELNSIISYFEATLKTKGAEGVKIIETNSLEVDDFSGKSRGIGAFFGKLSNGNLPNITSTVEAACDDIEKWYTKTSKKKDDIYRVVETQLQPLLRDIIRFYKENEKQYSSATAVKSQIRTLGILTDLKEEIKVLLNEKGMLQIADSNLLLSKIIGDSESPFIYEKIGNHFKYFMLDEFQDTSALQWKNFKPLLANSLSEGHANLLVGDVKQSIYRWRNSDWNILAEQVETDFPHFKPNTKNLDKNWRSDINIINFNNAVIENLKNSFENAFFAEGDDPDWLVYKEKFDNVFSDFHQEPGIKAKEENGWVSINFLEESDFEENSAKLVIDQVKQLQDKGLKASDIAILIRTNREGTPIIGEFLAAANLPENANYNLSVLSNESLFLHASKAVLFVISIVELLIDPDNKITKTTILNLWVTWLKPELKKLGFSFQQEKNSQFELDFVPEKTNQWHLSEDLEAEFEIELGKQIEKIKQKVLLTSLDESITEICAFFKLFKIKTELPFLQSLIDKAGEIKISVSNDLSNFLFWWNEKGYKTSVNVNEEVDSVRLLTVHKAKGLEFGAVLIPFFNWKTTWSGNQAPTLWCTSEVAPFNRLPLLPVKAKSDLYKTLFKTEYYNEKASNYIDTLNLIYVAFTRAKTALIVNSILPEEKKNTGNQGNTGKSANHLLKYALEQMELKTPFNQSWNNEKTLFEFGELIVSEQKESASKSMQITNYQCNDFKKRIQLRLSGEDFLIPGEKNRSVKNIGKLVHEILAGIETKNDIERTCLKAFLEGKIDETELKNIQQTLLANLEKPEVYQWFDGSYKVINERNLLTSEKILRPDRIMVSNNKAVVVDYKFGDKKSDSYNRQVERYAKIVKETGFEFVEGYLWYLGLDEVELVCKY